MTGRPGVATSIRLALVGTGTDRLRIGLSAVGSALAAVLVLAAVNVVGIGGERRGLNRYRWELLDQQGLHPGVVITLLALTIPLIAFVGQCIRIGAPARDRRLAALRLNGATGSEVARIVTLETVIAAGGGAVLGAIGFALTRTVLHREPVTVDGIEAPMTWPTDVSMPISVYLVVIAAVCASAAFATLSALRRTVIDPFGVTRRRETTAPATGPVLLLVVGLAGLFFLTGLLEALGVGYDDANWFLPIAFLGMAACGVGLTFGAAALAQRIGRFVRTRSSDAAVLLAAARLDATPYRASRNLGAVLLAVLIGAAIAQVRVGFLLATNPEDTFYADTFDLLGVAIVVGLLFAAAGLLVAAAEGITERRRTLAMLVATGVPRRVLARSVIAELLIPLVPGVVVAAASGTLAGRGYTGSETRDVSSVFDASSSSEQAELVPIPVPWRELLLICGGAIGAALVVTSASLLLLPASVATREIRTAA